MLDKIKYKETSTKCAILFVGNTTKGSIIVLKFQDNNTTVIATFEDFILTAYVIIEETSTKCAILFVGNTTKGSIIVLKFQDNNTTVIATFEDFILTAYVIIDELYHQFALPEVTR